MIGFGAGAGFLAGAAFGVVPAVTIGMVLITWLVATCRTVSPMAILVIGGAAALGAWRSESLPPAQDLRWLDDADWVSGTVVRAPSTRSDDQTFFVSLTPDGVGEAASSAGVRLYFRAPALPQVRPGDTVWIAGTVTPARELPSGFARFLRSNRASGTLTGYDVRVEARAGGWRQDPNLAAAWYGRMVARAAPGDRGALLAGLVTGRDDALSEERQRAFRRTGTSHITAVSGSNLALLLTIATLTGRMTRLRRRVWWQAGVVASLWGYALLAGFEPPVNRAAFVATGAVSAWLFGRRADALTLLAIAGAVLVAVHPLVLWSLSFQLSLAASAALALVVEPDDVTGWAGWLRAGVTGTVAAQVATLPFALGAFGQVPLLAVPTNLIVAPLASSAFLLAAVAGAVGVLNESAGEFVAVLAGVPAGWVLRTVDLLGGAWAPVPEFPTRPVETTIIAALCGLTICLWSRDGQAWLVRTVRDAASHRRRIAATFAPAIIGAAIVLAFTTR